MEIDTFVSTGNHIVEILNNNKVCLKAKFKIRLFPQKKIVIVHDIPIRAPHKI